MPNIFNDSDFLLKVIDCYFKKTYENQKDVDLGPFFDKKTKDFFNSFMKDWKNKN